jgi:hypothetical protein
MGESFSTHGKDEESIQNFSRKPEGNRHLRGLGVGGRIILKFNLKK